MRIIAGQHRGRILLPPANDATRPVTDRVKQSIFDILAPRLEGAVIFDLFAGTGSMGLECLSRGAKHVHFFEQERSALDRLRKNVAALNFSAESEIIPGDLFAWFAKRRPDLHADLIFLDPPYRLLTEQPDQLRQLAKDLLRGFFAADAAVIFRHDAADHLELPGLQKSDQRVYGAMAVEFLEAVKL